ncbi:MAG: sensor hybrid histidine kinase [Acidobacteriaceae bacterium]|jgi:PAS domain S-box-containing protein|nr:sensor hybrid histidine kinase [Acidobacteriaceae bacterium]
MSTPSRQMPGGLGAGASSAGGQREEAIAQEKVKILLVDDNPDNLVSIEAALDTLNEELVSARSGTEALRYLLESDFAAILLDVKMPDMDGFETAELIRSRKRSQHTPILFLTAYRNEEHLFRGYDLGAVDFLFKPIVPEILRSKVAVFVELSRSAQRQRRQAEILAKAELKFRSLLEAAPDAMLITTAEGEIVLANSRADDMFGYSRQELLGKNIRVVVPSWTLSSYHVGELSSVCKDSSTFPSEISSSPLQTEEGLLITSAIRDISERKRAEQRIAEQTQQLHEANRELRHLSSRIVAIRDEERRRLGRELHDSQGQYLAAIKMNLEMIETTDAALSTLQKSALTEAITLLERSMREIRVISHLLHPPLLDEIGLQAVVPWYLNSFSERSGIQIDLEMPSDISKLPDQVELAVFRVLQECLTNVHRHSGSKVAKVKILPEDTGVILEVSDRGRGVSSQNGSDPVMGVGITGMRERVRELGGQFEINSTSEGTIVRAVLPIGEQIGNHAVKLQSDLV